jgi:hypothetical protein
MKTKTLFRNTSICFIIAFSFGSCQNNAEDELFNITYENFHGKYKIVRCTSDKAIDINLDGLALTEMDKEIPDLANSYLMLMILKRTLPVGDGSHIFEMGWQEQIFIDGIQPEDYKPDRNNSINYANQHSVGSCTFSSDFKKINVKKYSDYDIKEYRWVLPESVTVRNDGLIEVIFTKRLYTSKGVQTVRITTLYKRFTKTT